MIFKSLIEELESNFKAFPNRYSIIDENNIAKTFKDFDDLVNQYYQVYKYLGLNNKHRLLIISKQSFTFYSLVMAAFKLGACAIILDKKDNLKSLYRKLKLSKVDYLISDFTIPLYYRILLKILFRIKTVVVNSVEIKSINKDQEFYGLDNSAALVNFTTGSTGLAKINTRTYEKLYFQTQELRKIIELHQFDNQLCFLPNVVLLNLLLAKSSFLFDNRNHWSELNSDNLSIDSIAGTPSHFMDLISRKDIINNKFFENVGVIFCGGSPLYYQQAKFILNNFPNSKSYSIYGATEAEPIAFCNLFELVEAYVENPNFGVLLGKAVESIQFIINPLNKGIFGFENTDFTIGELCVSGSHVFSSEINHFQHKTGDLVLNYNGRLFFLGRIAHLISINDLFIPLVPIENSIINLTNKLGTLIKSISGKVIMIIESESFLDENLIKSYIKLPVDYEIITIAKIPRDYRFSTKIDYLSLKSLIKE